MDTWNDEEWLDGVRRWYYGGQAPAAYQDDVAGMPVATPAPHRTDASAGLIATGCPNEAPAGCRCVAISQGRQATPIHLKGH